MRSSVDVGVVNDEEEEGVAGVGVSCLVVEAGLAVPSPLSDGLRPSPPAAGVEPLSDTTLHRINSRLAVVLMKNGIGIFTGKTTRMSVRSHKRVTVSDHLNVCRACFGFLCE